MAFHFNNSEFIHLLTKNQYVLLFISLFMIISVGWHFIDSAYKSLVNAKSMTMDTLVALGIILSFVISVEDMFISHMNMLYFETTISLIAFINIGRIIELYVKNKSTNDLSYIESLQPTQVLINDTLVDVNDVKVGDVITVNKGEVIPLNGVLMSISAQVDMSNLTGESLLQTIKYQGELLSGSVVYDQDIEIKVTKDINDSSLTKIIESIYNSQFDAPQIQKNVDKVSKVFVPFIIIVSIITFIF